MVLKVVPTLVLGLKAGFPFLWPVRRQKTQIFLQGMMRFLNCLISFIFLCIL